MMLEMIELLPVKISKLVAVINSKKWLISQVIYI
jgi:hypothetical protein